MATFTQIPTVSSTGFTDSSLPDGTYYYVVTAVDGAGTQSDPSNRASAEKAAAGVPDQINQLYILRYGMEHWDADRIDMEIGQVAAWAKKRNAPVLCNEFGVYREFADPKDRAAWIRDVRSALERRGLGWTMWDYSGGFGVVTKGKNHPAVDQLTVEGLGLTRH